MCWTEGRGGGRGGGLANLQKLRFSTKLLRFSSNKIELNSAPNLRHFGEWDASCNIRRSDMLEAVNQAGAYYGNPQQDQGFISWSFR
jgi:hypothetical protein